MMGALGASMLDGKERLIVVVTCITWRLRSGNRGSCACWKRTGRGRRLHSIARNQISQAMRGTVCREAMIKVCDKVEMGAETFVRASFAVKATCATQQRRGEFAMSL